MTMRDVSRLPSGTVTNEVRPDSTERIKAALELALRDPAGRQSDRNPDDKTSVQRSDVMSGANEQVPADRRDPPSPARPLRERRTPGSAAVEDARRVRIEERLEEPPQPPVVEPRPSGKAFGVMARLVAAVGVAAMIALFAVKMMPAAKHQDDRASVPDAGQSVTTAFPQPPTQPEAPRKPALAEFEALQRSGPAPAAEPEQAAKPSDSALQQFLQWREKPVERTP
jgi:hypothetical protein